MVLLFLLVSVLLASNNCSLLKNGIDLFRKLKHDSHEFMMPYISNMFLMPNTRSTFSCICDTNVNTPYLWPCIPIIIGMMNNTLMNYPFPTLILCIFDAHFGNECKD